MAKDLLKTNQAKNKQIVGQVNDPLIDLRNDVNTNKNPDKMINIVEKSFTKQQKGKELKELTSKQMLERSPKALPQVKVGNTPENLLNELIKFYILYIEQTKLLKNYMTI